jgi:hypothetical protein
MSNGTTSRPVAISAPAIDRCASTNPRPILLAKPGRRREFYHARQQVLTNLDLDLGQLLADCAEGHTQFGGGRTSAAKATEGLEPVQGAQRG